MICLNSAYVSEAHEAQTLKSMKITIDHNCCSKPQEYTATFDYSSGAPSLCVTQVYFPNEIDYIISISKDDVNLLLSHTQPEDINFGTWDSDESVLTLVDTADYAVVYENGEAVKYDFYCANSEHITSTDIELRGDVICLPTLALTDGVYSITLETETDTEIISEKFCMFSDLNIKCAIAKIPDNQLLVEAYQLYEGLKFAEECANDCECENMCVIYNELLKLLQNVDFTPKPLACGSNKSSCEC